MFRTQGSWLLYLRGSFSSFGELGLGWKEEKASISFPTGTSEGTVDLWVIKPHPKHQSDVCLQSPISLAIFLGNPEHRLWWTHRAAF